MIALYVDDVIIASNDKRKMNETKECLKNVFEMKDLSEPNRFLGMRISRDRKSRTIQIYQVDYAEKILERFGMKKCAAMFIRQATREDKRKRFRVKTQNQCSHTEKRSTVCYI